MKYISIPFSMLEATTFQVKLLGCFILGSIFTPIVYISDYYKGILLENKNFVVVIFVAFLVDIVCGSWKHYKTGDFSWTDLFTIALKKLSITFMAMLLFNGMVSIEGIEDSGIKVYLLIVGKLMNFWYLAGSAFNNMYYITDHKFPPYAWMKRMKDFNKTLDLNKLKGNETDTPTPSN